MLTVVIAASKKSGSWGAVCQVSHGFECQGDIHTMIDHNILKDNLS